MQEDSITSSSPPRLCECGCGEVVKPDRRFVNHHNSRLQVKKVHPVRLCACGCGRPVKTKGYQHCKGHGHGKPRILEEFFFENVDKGDGRGCEHWTGPRSELGYGQVYITDRKSGKAERRPATHVAWKIHYGEYPPKELDVCHHCDTPSCVRISHLFLGTRRENMQDAKKKNRPLGRPTGIPSKIKGELHPFAKLTEADVIEIRRLWSEKQLTQGEIAERYHIGQGHVHRIVHRLRWAHVE